MCPQKVLIFPLLFSILSSLYSGEPPLNSTGIGVLPEIHGIAFPFAFADSHHVALALIMCEEGFATSEDRKRVSEELKLDKDRLSKLAECLNELKEHNERAFVAQLVKKLDAKSRARFQELACQLSGPMVLQLDHYANRLQLSAAQQTKIQKVIADYMGKVGPFQVAIFTARTDKEVPPFQKKLNALARELDAKILELLSEKQREEWALLLGKKFDWGRIGSY